MNRSWTLGRRIGVGFAGVIALSVLGGLVSLAAVRALVEESDDSSVEGRELAAALQLEAVVDAQLAEVQSLIVTRDERLRDTSRATQANRDASLAKLLAGARTADAKRLLGEASRRAKEADGALDSLVRERLGAAAAAADKLAPVAVDQEPTVRALRQALQDYTHYEQQTLDEQHEERVRTASRTNGLVTAAALAVLLAGGLAGVLLTRVLTRDIGSAVSHVQSSSTELQSAANQQATASKEQAAATNETTTTIRELVATARQIAESAQRVSQSADTTAAAARKGEQSIQRAQEGLGVIKRQVDVIVNHMLELGKKSQQIGGILEIINELSEQTNILAINATIEASGAGDAGKRFAAVADEIRKLADRVGGSTKDIRSLIEEIRTAVNTTVMATEQGTKSVDLGARQVGEAATTFDEIARMVDTTTEAAREIELSTKQQTTAVEQVNVAMLNVAQAAKETEATSGATLQTASMLSSLSRDLTRMIRAESRA